MAVDRNGTAVLLVCGAGRKLDQLRHKRLVGRNLELLSAHISFKGFGEVVVIRLLLLVHFAVETGESDRGKIQVVDCLHGQRYRCNEPLEFNFAADLRHVVQDALSSLAYNGLAGIEVVLSERPEGLSEGFPLVHDPVLGPQVQPAVGCRSAGQTHAALEARAKVYHRRGPCTGCTFERLHLVDGKHVALRADAFLVQPGDAVATYHIYVGIGETGFTAFLCIAPDYGHAQSLEMVPGLHFCRPCDFCDTLRRNDHQPVDDTGLTQFHE